MNFLVDQQLPQSLAAWLTAQGHFAEHVRNVGLRDADDGVIWRYALERNATILTKDQDFPARRAASAAGPVIVWLRIGNATTAALLAWLEHKWLAIEAAIASGDVIIEVR